MAGAPVSLIHLHMTGNSILSQLCECSFARVSHLSTTTITIALSDHMTVSRLSLALKQLNTTKQQVG